MRSAMYRALANAHPPLHRSAVLLAAAALTGLLAGACGAPQEAPRSGAAVLPTSSVELIPTAVSTLITEPTPTYDPQEHNLTPTITPPTKEPGTPQPPLPTSQPSDPYTRQVLLDFGAPPTVAQEVQAYGMFVSGRVIELLPAQWTTPDGERPANPFTVDEREIYIITPVVVELEGPALVNRYDADLSSGRIVVAAFGGQVGQDSVASTDPSQQFGVGEHVLLGLSNHPYLNGN